MKRIKIDKIVEPHPNPFYIRDQYFWVWLGNGTKHQFTSKRNALAFLAQVNRFLNNKLHEANFLYCEVFTQYRENWFYFWHNKKNYDNGLNLKLRLIETRLKDCMEAFDMLVTRSHLPNGNHFVWVHFNNIFNAMDSICSELIALQKSRSNGAEAQVLRILLDRVNITRNQLNGYLKNIELKNEMDLAGRIIPLILPASDIDLTEEQA